jgi:solute carrier family 25 2-oxodicarboxylate transporter 21
MNDILINCLSGSLSGVAEVTISHPLDRIKTRLQESALEHKNISLKNCIEQISNEKGFYKGFSPRIIGIMPMRFTYWGTLISMNNITKHESNTVKYILPGLVAGCVQSCIDNPIEVIKIKLMTNNNNNIINYNKLYNGFSACLIRNILFAIPVGICTRLCLFDNSFLAGATGGIIGSLISHPFDVMKTEIQRCNSKHTSYVEIVKDLYKYNPMKLWSGVSVRATLGCINMSIGFLAFDHINKICSNVFHL